ncbi:MAG: cyclic lactone autoinducer peptide [Oscillospiraceae bacterium]
MKKSNIIKISEIAKKYAFRGSSALLTALAIVFASATCLTHFYEPEVPRKLWEKD